MFQIDPDKPNVPAIARILYLFGMLGLIGSIASMLLAFSGFPWVNETYAVAGAGAAFVLAVLMIGQAKTVELLAVVSARVKSRFAIDHAVIPGAAAPAAAPKPAGPPPKERVITIPEDVARQQGLTRMPPRPSPPEPGGSGG
jgi:hypothetical protein